MLNIDYKSFKAFLHVREPDSRAGVPIRAQEA